mmetsp:Transcript_26504/g.44800  ORF Transcript_26504/g.44800 Transcript_26504/m.44800 type:complete len:533 (-) Transcript_26504:114-1712(-)
MVRIIGLVLVLHLHQHLIKSIDEVAFSIAAGKISPNNAQSIHGNRSLCVSMFFCDRKFHLEAQSDLDLTMQLPALCHDLHCTEHLQSRIHQQHQVCLQYGTETSLGDSMKGESVITRRVEGLCITTVGTTNAARFYTPSLLELDNRLEVFCQQNRISDATQVSLIRQYVIEKCFIESAEVGSESPRRLLMSPTSKVTDESYHNKPSKKKKVFNNFTTFDRVINAMHRTRSFYGSNGLLMLPHYKLAVCVPPKSGMVSILYVLLAILGNHPRNICGCGYDNANGVHPKFGCLGMEGLRHYSSPMYEGLIFVNDDIRFDTATNTTAAEGKRGKRLLTQAFTDPEWKSVMIVRDPWRRAISAFHEDNGYQNWINISSAHDSFSPHERRQAMLKYLQHPETYNHAMPAASVCHLTEGLRYDHYYDIDSGIAGLADILAETSPPVPREYLTSGWESCTEGESESILDARLKTSHTWTESRKQLDDIYCTPSMVRQAIRHFREDYKLLGELAGFPVFPSCLSMEDKIALLTGDVVDDE